MTYNKELQQQELENYLYRLFIEIYDVRMHHMNPKKWLQDVCKDFPIEKKLANKLIDKVIARSLQE